MGDSRRTRVILGSLLLLCLVLITVDYRGGENSPLNGLRDIGATIFGPVSRAGVAVLGPAGALLGGDDDDKVKTLERENRELREQLQTGRLDANRADQLDRLLYSAGKGGYRILAAQVISVSKGFENTVAIDVGERDGVRQDMTVMTGDGLVGRVTRVGPRTSTVMLISDPASSAGGRLEDSKEIGVLRGAGGRGLRNVSLKFQLLDTSAPLRPGQRIVTFGSHGGRPYVPGVPVGAVTKVEQTPGSLTKTAYIKPFAHLTGLDVVGVVIAPPKDDPRDAVLPPKPAG